MLLLRSTQHGQVLQLEICSSFIHHKDEIEHFMNSKIAYIKGVIVTALKYVAETFTLILAAVVNNYLSSNNYSDVLRITRSVPVSKKGNPESLKSSLISLIAKYSKPR